MKPSINKIKAGLAIFLIAIFSGCGSGVVYDETVDFDAAGWHKDNPAIFNVNITDTAKVMDVGFTFRHNEGYPYSNLWLFLTVEGPGSLSVRDTLELYLARPDGSWLGRKRGDVLEISALYQHDVKMAQPGEYRFTVIQGMRRDLLPNISSVEFWIQDGSK